MAQTGKKKNDLRSKSERMRDERRKRLNAQRDKSGAKKPVRPADSTARTLFPIVAVVVVLAIVLWGAVQLGIPQQLFRPMRIGDRTISGAEFSYYYSMTLQGLYLDPSTADGQQRLKQKCTLEGFTDLTWKEYAQQKASEQVRDVYIQVENAKARNLSLATEDIDLIDNYFEQLVQQNGNNAANANAYLEQQFGKGVTMATLRPVFENVLLADRFYEDKLEDLTVSAEDIEAAYGKDKDAYDQVDYRSMFVKTKSETGMTDEEKKAADEAAKKKAEDLLADATDEASFKAAAEAYLEELKKEQEATITPSPSPSASPTPSPSPTASPSPTPTPAPVDASLNADKTQSNLSLLGEEASKWLLDATRKAGDTIVVKGTLNYADGYHVFYFLERTRQDAPVQTVRHILVTVARATATEEQLAEAEEKAEGFLALVEGKDEDTFAALAKEKSEDTGSKPDGGLIEDFSKNQMVKEFEEWAFAEGRKAGDTGIVQSDYGFHVMYYVGNRPAYSVTIEKNLLSERFEAFLEAEREKADFAIRLNPFGLSWF